MVAASKLAASNDKELYLAFFIGDIEAGNFSTAYNHDKWSQNCKREIIVPGLVARFYSQTGRGVIIHRDQVALFRQWCRCMRGLGGFFNPAAAPLGYDYFANILVHCIDVPGMLSIRRDEGGQEHRYGKNLPDLNLDDIFGPRPAPAPAPAMSEKREKLLNDLLADKAIRDLKFQDRRAAEKAAKGTKRGPDEDLDNACDAFLYPTRPKKQFKTSKGKGRPVPFKHDNSSITEAQNTGNSSKKAQESGKPNSNPKKSFIPPRNPSPPAEDLADYENPSPFNRDSENSSSHIQTDELWSEGDVLLPHKPESWSKDDWKTYCFAHADRIKDEMGLEMAEYMRVGFAGGEQEGVKDNMDTSLG